MTTNSKPSSVTDDGVGKIAQAVLYEGYLLYPYRPSTKNRQRWTFGGIYPREWCAVQQSGDVAAIERSACSSPIRRQACRCGCDSCSLSSGKLGEYLHPWHNFPLAMRSSLNRSSRSPPVESSCTPGRKPSSARCISARRRSRICSVGRDRCVSTSAQPVMWNQCRAAMARSKPCSSGGSNC